MCVKCHGRRSFTKIFGGRLRFGCARSLFTALEVVNKVAQTEKDQKVLSDYVYPVKHIRNGKLIDAQKTGLKSNPDSFLNKGSILSRLVQSEIGTPMQCRLNLVETADGIHVEVL